MSGNSRNRKGPVRSLGIEWVAIPFQFTPSSSDTTAAPTVLGPISAASGGTSATGIYTVTVLGGGYPAMVVEANADVALKGVFQVEAANVNATIGSFQVRCYNFGTSTLANFTATTSAQKVHGTIWAQASSYTR